MYNAGPNREIENQIEAGWAVPEGAAIMTSGAMATCDLIVVGMDGKEKSRRKLPRLKGDEAVAGPTTFGARRVVLYGANGDVIVIDDHGVELARWSASQKDDSIAELTLGEEHNGELVADALIGRQLGWTDWKWVFASLKLTAAPQGLSLKGTEVSLEESKKVLGLIAPRPHHRQRGAVRRQHGHLGHPQPGEGPRPQGALSAALRRGGEPGRRAGADHRRAAVRHGRRRLWADGASPVCFVGWGGIIYRIECSQEAAAK